MSLTRSAMQPRWDLAVQRSQDRPSSGGGQEPALARAHPSCLQRRPQLLRLHTRSLVLPPCPTLCGPVNCSPPGFFVPSFPGRNTGEGFTPFSRISQTRDETRVPCVSCVGRGVPLS